ncbi:hypothetical protein AB0C02_13305 [Micromonospora sp. NPDC048999]|uniref:hypothetical protein n=1 Tax=Micromonospora sp. NPDC048999 TaxID=3155391 RepID=UPI0033FE2ADF
MMEINSTGVVDELYASVEAATVDTPYRMCRTKRGFDLIVDVNVPQWRVLLTRRRITQVHTYRVALRPEQKVFTMTDVVRTVEYEAGLGGLRLGKTVSVGRSVSVVSHRALDGSDQYTFSSAEGHRLIRGAAGELGWREAQPASVKVAMGFAIIGGLGAIAAVIALAIVNWL